MTSLVELAYLTQETTEVAKAGALRQTVRSVTNARQIGQGNKLRAAAHLSGGTAGQTFRGDLSTLSRRELRDANKIWRNQTAAAARNPGFSKASKLAPLKARLKNASLPSQSRKLTARQDKIYAAQRAANRPKLTYDVRGNVTNPSHELW